MKKSIQNTPPEIIYLIRVYFSGIIAFTVFRLVLLIAEYNHAAGISKSLIAQAFLIGLRFDTVVCCYILAIPALLLIVNLFLRKTGTILFRISNVILILFFTIAFIIACADILYFDHFLTRVTISVLSWTHNPGFMFQMVYQNWINYVFISVLLLLIIYIYKRIIKIYRSVINLEYGYKKDIQFNSYVKNSLIAIVVLPTVFIGIRGRIALKSPIQWGTAYFSDNNFVNQLGLNPVFTFMKSYINSLNPENVKIHFIDNNAAIKTIQDNLGIKNNNLFSSPLARKIDVTGEPLKANVVIVIMESMGLSKTGLDNNPINMTPHLDSLAKVSYTFTDVFSAGIHTFNGVYSTLFGMPALMNQHPMFATESVTQPFTGIAYTLDKCGYQSMFICPHDAEFDNMGGFLTSNGFQKIVSEKDFPSDEIHSTMGVPDDVLFEHAVKEINGISKSPKPFLVSILTGSDHEPAFIPEGHGFVPKTTETKQQLVEYADWSINKFLKLSSKQLWYDNTIFVFVADHGSWYRDYYEMNLSYHKIPLIIFSPKLIKPTINSSVGGQIDVFPTVMGLLNQPYINNTMGVDLIKEGRKYIAFSADDRLGCATDQYFWYYNYNAKNEYLLHYRDRDPKQYLGQFPLLKDTLENYAHSLLQTTQWMIDNKKVGPQK